MANSGMTRQTILNKVLNIAAHYGDDLVVDMPMYNQGLSDQDMDDIAAECTEAFDISCGISDYQSCTLDALVNVIYDTLNS